MQVKDIWINISKTKSINLSNAISIDFSLNDMNMIISASITMIGGTSIQTNKETAVNLWQTFNDNKIVNRERN